MKLKLDNIKAHVTFATSEERRWLYDYLAFPDKNARWTPSYQAGTWDGKIRMYNHLRAEFPAGLMTLVAKGASRTGYAVEVEDLRVKVEPVAADTSWLDPMREQPQAVDACLAAGRGIVWAPTGSGKSELFVALGQRIPGRWLVLLHRKDLLHQAAERFELRTGEKAGIVGDGEFRPERWTVATYQTLYRLRREARVRELLEGIDAVAGDEIHVVPARTFASMFSKTRNAYWRFGFSATPIEKGDPRSLTVVAMTGPVIYKVDPQVLISRGVLAQPEIQFIKMPQVIAATDYAAAYQEGIVRSKHRNEIAADIAAKAPKPGLVFVEHLEHGHALEALLVRRGINARFVQGSDTTPERKEAIKNLRRGDLDVLVCSNIFDVGVDIPELRAAVNAAGGGSKRRAIQRLGRVLRVVDGKQTVEFWDFDDAGCRWLSTQARGRKKAYRDAGFTVREFQTTGAPAAS